MAHVYTYTFTVRGHTYPKTIAASDDTSIRHVETVRRKVEAEVTKIYGGIVKFDWTTRTTIGTGQPFQQVHLVQRHDAAPDEAALAELVIQAVELL
jgi:hypothetical protein